MPITTHRACPMCSSSEQRPLKSFKAQHLVACTRCGFVFATWHPSAQELQTYYSGYPAVTRVSPVTITRYNELLDRFAPYRKTGNLIDVGCGAGLFLQQAALRNWNVHGTEFGQRCVEECRSRGVPLIEGPLNTANYAAGSFDVVCSFEVIEHLVDPRAELERFRTLLRIGGLLYVTTPNFDCMARRIAPTDWNVASYPEHLMYFTVRSMDRMMREMGFRRMWATTTGFSIYRWQLSKGARPGDRKSAMESQEKVRTAMETRPIWRFAKRSINGTLNLLRLGDSMKVAYVKI